MRSEPSAEMRRLVEKALDEAADHNWITTPNAEALLTAIAELEQRAESAEELMDALREIEQWALNGITLQPFDAVRIVKNVRELYERLFGAEIPSRKKAARERDAYRAALERIVDTKQPQFNDGIGYYEPHTFCVSCGHSWGEDVEENHDDECAYWIAKSASDPATAAAVRMLENTEEKENT